MKRPLQILATALVLFLAVSMAQEWELFWTAWSGTPRATPLAAEARAGAEGAVRGYLSLMRHLYASGGDRRFAERLPASPELLDELIADGQFLQHTRTRQESSLVRLEFLSAERAGESAVAVVTREYWIIHLARMGEGPRPPSSYVTTVRYVVRRDGAGWKVQAWDLTEAPATAREG